MPLRVEIDADAVYRLLDAFDSVLLSDSLLADAGDFAVDRILERTAQGKDIDGDAFTQYSPSYDKSGPVNLRVTGAMLDSISSRPSGSQAVISCDSEIAGYHQKGTPRMPVRQFMGLSDADVSDMLEEVFFAPINAF